MARPSILASRTAARDRGRRHRWRVRVARRVLSFVCLAVALLLTYAAAHTPDDHLTSVVVAGDNLLAGHTLTADDLAMAQVSVSVARIARTAAMADLVGRRLVGPVARGEAIPAGLLMPRSVLDGLPPESVALHIHASDPAVLDLLSPGQVVGLRRIQDGATVATGVRVLSIDVPPDPGVLGFQEKARGLVVALDDTDVDRAITPDSGHGASSSGVLAFHVIPQSGSIR